MKIRRIWLKDYYQFKDVHIDLTNPETGEPLDKVCFIGKNGVGKSLLLKKIIDIVTPVPTQAVAAEVVHEKKIYILLKVPFDYHGRLFTEGIAKDTNWLANLFHEEGIILEDDIIQNKFFLDTFYNYITLYPLVIYSPAETVQNNYINISDVPDSNVNTALTSKIDNGLAEVSGRTVNAFWTQLISLIKQRENDRNEFELKKENINKTKKQLIEEFDETHPKILESLAKLWNRVLEPCGLYFDAETANNPVQLTDNLLAYIRTKDGKKVPYNSLSTGVRNFIFKLGHIYSLYFNRKVDSSFLLVDEPENSLHPDFLYDLIDIYQQCTIDKTGHSNTQFFVATHSPIIAAQFEPYERIILDWDENGNVKVERGSSPIGDDPNDLLKKDFHVQNLLGKKGLEKWKRFIELKKQLSSAKDEDKPKIVEELTKIGSEYHF